MLCLAICPALELRALHYLVFRIYLFLCNGYFIIFLFEIWGLEKQQDMRKELRIVFIGTPDFAVESLDALIKANKNVVAVITAPDRKAGRGRKLNESAVKKYAIQHEIPVLQPTNLKSQSFLNELAEFKADLQIVVAFRMLPEAVWDMPPLGTFNLHASLLPNYRGAAPINWAIINGEKETGVSTFFLKHKIDTGDIIFQEKVSIENEETAGSLHDKLMKIGGGLVLKTVNAIEVEDYALTSQHETTVKEAPKIFKEDCKIDWNQSAEKIDRLIRGLSPYPTAWCTISSEKEEKKFNLKLFKSAILQPNSELNVGEISVLNGRIMIGCGDGILQISELQLEGKKRMLSKDLLNGFSIEEFRMDT